MSLSISQQSPWISIHLRSVGKFLDSDVIDISHRSALVTNISTTSWLLTLLDIIHVFRQSLNIHIGTFNVSNEVVNDNTILHVHNTINTNRSNSPMNFSNSFSFCANESNN
ncbi:Uncharacterised protein r2_g2537 [Pycnogonum litorale]